VFRVTDLKIVSVATPDLDGSVATFRKNFGFPISRTGDTPAAKTRSTFLAIGAAEIELATPTGEGSPLASFLAERGAGLHQLVLEVDDLEAARADFVARGIEVIVKPGSDGKPAGFLSSSQTHGVRITLVGP
jgi:methylmalonyl-CoA/ethylmalonyl-CoA epimerase